MFVPVTFLWALSAHLGICPLSRSAEEAEAVSGDLTARYEVNVAHEKGLMCNRLKQRLLSSTSLIAAGQGESLPLWDWVSGLTQL